MSNATSLKFFMCEELKQEMIVEVPGIQTFCDDKGEPVPFKLRAIGSDELNKIRDGCHIRKMVKDKKGKPMFLNGQIQYTDEYDNVLLTDMLIVSSLVFPDLRDKELLAFYNEQDSTKLVHKVFRKIEDYKYISEKVMEVSGITDDADDVIDTVKN